MTAPPTKEPIKVWGFVVSHDRMDDSRYTLVTLDNGMQIPVDSHRVVDFLVGTQVRIEMKKATEP